MLSWCEEAYQVLRASADCCRLRGGPACTWWRLHCHLHSKIDAENISMDTSSYNKDDVHVNGLKWFILPDA